MFFKGLITAVFPNTCAACHSIIDENEFLCDYCMAMLENCGSHKLCIKCGLPKGECRCKKDVYYFDGIIAPFFRETTAKNAMYDLKFRKNERVSRYFAERMALSVKQYYSDINIDLVTFVPMSKKAKKKRGYNQSELIAKDLAEILKFQFKDDILKSHIKKHSQYKLSIKQRRENVKGIFYSDYKLNGQTVLLVDDIKTTGATLNECAKVLLSIGADKVYCVTGLISRSKNRLAKGKNKWQQK